jgi:hypothetical protein
MTKVRATPSMTRRDARDLRRIRQRFARRLAKRDRPSDYGGGSNPGTWPGTIQVWFAKGER